MKRKKKTPARKTNSDTTLKERIAAAEKTLGRIRERVKTRLATKRRTPSPLNLSPLDQLRRLTLDNVYREYFASHPHIEEFQKEYPELTAPTDPDLLVKIFKEGDAGENQKAEAFISPPVKVLRTFNPFDIEWPTKRKKIVVNGEERTVDTPDRKSKTYPEILYPEGSNTFFYKQDLLQGRFLHVQIDLQATKEEVLKQFEAVLDAARKAAGRTKKRQRPISKESWKIIEASRHLRTSSPKRIAAEVSPELYIKKTSKNLRDRRTLEKKVVWALKKAKSMDI